MRRNIKNHCSGFFGKSHKAAHVTDDRISAYIAHRKDEKAKNATINRELACLRRMFRLGEKARKVVFRPETRGAVGCALWRSTWTVAAHPVRTSPMR